MQNLAARSSQSCSPTKRLCGKGIFTSMPQPGRPGWPPSLQSFSCCLLSLESHASIAWVGRALARPSSFLSHSLRRRAADVACATGTGVHASPPSAPCRNGSDQPPLMPRFQGACKDPSLRWCSCPGPLGERADASCWPRLQALCCSWLGGTFASHSEPVPSGTAAQGLSAAPLAPRGVPREAGAKLSAPHRPKAAPPHPTSKSTRAPWSLDGAFQTCKGGGLLELFLGFLKKPKKTKGLWRLLHGLWRLLHALWLMLHAFWRLLHAWGPFWVCRGCPSGFCCTP